MKFLRPENRVSFILTSANLFAGPERPGERDSYSTRCMITGLLKVAASFAIFSLTWFVGPVRNSDRLALSCALNLERI